MKDYVFIPKKREQNVINSLNILIHDYLVKMKFEKTAKIFSTEAFIQENCNNDSTPALFQWYLAFHEISNIRCGISSDTGDLARIEGVMLKLENEKKRYQQMGRIDNLNQYGINDMMKSPNINYFSEQSNLDPRRGKDLKVKSGEQNFKYKYHYNNNISISPKMFENNTDPFSNNDKEFKLKIMHSIKISDKNIIYSVMSKDFNILFNVFNNMTIGSFNCITLKNECIVETNSKQISQIRIKDTPDFIWIVASFDTNDLMVIRYLVKDCKFEMAGYLRGHTDKILCFDVSEYIYSIDVKGLFRKWNFKGYCEKEDFFNGKINKLFSFTENCLIISDGIRTYLYDHEINMDMSEISKGILVDIKKQDNLFLLIFTDKVLIYDKALNKLKILSVPDNSVKSATLIDFDIIIGSSKILWYESLGRLNKCTVLEKSDILSIENISNYKQGHILVISKNGEIKILTKSNIQ